MLIISLNILEQMAKIELQPGADPLQVAEDLRKSGIVLHRRLTDGAYVAFVPHRRWMVMHYPALEPLYREDREFWRDVKRRTRDGEEVPQAEIEAHAEWFKKREQQIIESYEAES